MLKLIVFDMAGTTVKDQHEVEACFAKAAAQTGLQVNSAQILAMQGYSKIEVFNLLWRETAPHLNENELAQKVQNSYLIFCNILEDYYLHAPIIPTEGCLELFDFLRKNEIKIALTTGFYRKVTHIILDKLGWLNGLNCTYIGNSNSIIDVSIASDEVTFGRPKPDMIFKAMELLGIKNPNEVIAIGDTPSDLAAGKAAACFKTFGLTNGTHSRGQLSDYESDGLFQSLAEFQNYLSENSLKINN